MLLKCDTNDRSRLVYIFHSNYNYSNSFKEHIRHIHVATKISVTETYTMVKRYMKRGRNRKDLGVVMTVNVEILLLLQSYFFHKSRSGMFRFLKIFLP